MQRRPQAATTSPPTGARSGPATAVNVDMDDPRAVNRAHLSGNGQQSLLRRHAATLITIFLMVFVLTTLVGADDNSRSGGTDGAGKRQPRFYGRWPGLSASATAKALSWVSKVIDAEAGASVFDPPAPTKSKIPLMVPGSDKTWVAVCAHRAAIDDASASTGSGAAAAAAVAGDESKGRSIAQSIIDLKVRFGILCSDIDIFLAKDGTVFAGHTGIAATTLLGDGTKEYSSETGAIVLGNMTAAEIKKLDPVGAVACPFSEVAASIATVSTSILAPGSIVPNAAGEYAHLPPQPGPSGVTSPLLFSVEPKASVVDPDTRADLIAALSTEDACAEARASATTDPTTLSHTALERCTPLLTALKKGPLARLLRRAAPLLSKAGVGVPFATAGITDTTGGDDKTSQWSPVRFIVDMDSVVFELLCLLAHDACVAAHAPGSIGNNPIDAYFSTTRPVDRWTAPGAAWVASILLRSIVMVGSGRLGDEAAAAIAKDIAAMAPAAFIVPLKDRWLTHRSALAARRAKHDFYAAIEKAKATAASPTTSDGETARAATTMASAAPTIDDNATVARLKEVVTRAARRAKIAECSALQAFSHHFADERGIAETERPVQREEVVEASISPNATAASGHESSSPTTVSSSRQTSHSGTRPAKEQHRILALPAWAAHVMPSVLYLKTCFAADPKLLQRSMAPPRHDAAAAQGAAAVNTPSPGDATAVAAATASDPRTFHCWLVDSEGDALDAVIGLHCSHLVSNKPLMLSTAGFAFAPYSPPPTPSGTAGQQGTDAAVAADAVVAQKKENAVHLLGKRERAQS